MDGRAKWTDERLDDRKATVDQAFLRLEEALRSFAPVGGQVASIEAEIEGLREDVADFKVIAHAAEERAQKSRKDMLIAVLGFAGPVTVAIIGGVVTLILGGVG